jgi:hypothetical protein
MKRFTVLAAALLALFIVGCGGSIGNGGANPLTGSYRSQFNRGNSPIPSLVLATVETDGTTTIVISDANGVAYSGIGTATTVTNLTATLSGPGGTVNVTGSFIGQSTPQLLLHFTGAVNNDVGLLKFANINTSPFMGALTVNTAGDESGTASITVAADGSISGTASSPSGGNFPVIGAVDTLGSVNFHGNGTVSSTPTEFTYTGTLFQKPTVSIDVAGNGTFDIGGSSAGTWTAD